MENTALSNLIEADTVDFDRVYYDYQLLKFDQLEDYDTYEIRYFISECDDGFCDLEEIKW